MKIKIGDKVRFLNEVGGGKVSRIANKIVYIEDADGFEIPTRIEDIVLIEQSAPVDNFSKPITKQPVAQPEKSKPAPQAAPKPEPESDGDDYEFLLAFVPTNQTKAGECDTQMYLINDSPYRCMYIVSEWTSANKMRLMNRGDLEADTKELVTLLTPDALRKPLVLNISLIMYKYRDYKLQIPEQVNVDFNPVKFVKPSSYKENDFFDENAFIYKIASSAMQNNEITIDADEMRKAMTAKKDTKPVVKATTYTEAEEIDLHIEEIIESKAGMSNGEIIQTQISRFTTALDLGISSGTQRMVFIHGIGNGKLKHEIRRLLDTTYAGKVRYQDASFKEYGYGATMVILK